MNIMRTNTLYTGIQYAHAMPDNIYQIGLDILHTD